MPSNTSPQSQSSPSERRVSRSDSVPNLATITAGQRASAAAAAATAAINNTSSSHQSATMASISPINHKSVRHRNRNSSMIHRASPSDKAAATSPYLHPSGKLQFHRHAMSVDETGQQQQYYTKSESVVESNSNNNNGNSSTSNRIRDRTKRSDTARKHVLARQKPIEKEEPVHSPRGTARRLVE